MYGVQSSERSTSVYPAASAAGASIQRSWPPSIVSTRVSAGWSTRGPGARGPAEAGARGPADDGATSAVTGPAPIGPPCPRESPAWFAELPDPVRPDEPRHDAPKR